jgi:glutathione S-transferase
MDPILFYGVPEGCSLGAIVALEWTGRPYRLCRIEMPGQVSGEAFRRINPLGETPSFMTASGEVFSQSAAILRHIAGGPADPRLDEMLSFLTTSYFGGFSPLWQAVEGATDAEKAFLIPNGRKKVAKAHAQLEALLAGRDWLVGDGPTIADAYFYGVARWNDFHHAIERSQYPAVNRLFRRLSDDPAIRFALAIEHEEPAVSAGGFRGHVSLEEVLEGLAVPA